MPIFSTKHFLIFGSKEVAERHLESIAFAKKTISNSARVLPVLQDSPSLQNQAVAGSWRLEWEEMP